MRNARVVGDGDLVTAGGSTSGLELALRPVRREPGADAATNPEETPEHEARGTVRSSRPGRWGRSGRAPRAGAARFPPHR
ncbi:hypothetical protein ACH4ZU_00040 [Streptomyces sp. NPDC020472]|uniref:hypothetical protein n=1 Tax=Streptomyces sp. NPDC020472 TaxID=3365075 RepID=UPI0037B6B965